MNSKHHEILNGQMTRNLGRLDEYTFVMAATERDYKFEPHDTCDIAQRRKRAVLADRSLACDCDPD